MLHEKKNMPQNKYKLKHNLNSLATTNGQGVMDILYKA